jgi:transposase InsO family protein
VIDCYTKAIIGWAMDDNYKTPLIEEAIRMATRNYTIAPQAISDRGSNYTSSQFAATLAALGIRQSVGRTGICYDNAMAESFFAVLKNERLHRTEYPTRQHAMTDIARYIELRYTFTTSPLEARLQDPTRGLQRVPEPPARSMN